MGTEEEKPSSSSSTFLDQTQQWLCSFRDRFHASSLKNAGRGFYDALMARSLVVAEADTGGRILCTMRVPASLCVSFIHTVPACMRVSVHIYMRRVMVQDLLFVHGTMRYDEIYVHGWYHVIHTHESITCHAHAWTVTCHLCTYISLCHQYAQMELCHPCTQGHIIHVATNVGLAYHSGRSFVI